MPSVNGAPVIESGEWIDGPIWESWVKFADGTMECRITTNTDYLPNGPDGEGTFTWMYPKPFINANVDVFINALQSFASGGGRVALGDFTHTTETGMVGYRYNTDTNVSVNGPIVIIAKGRWK